MKTLVRQRKARSGLTAKKRAAPKKELTARQQAALASLRKTGLGNNDLTTPGERVWFGVEVDERPAVQTLFHAVKKALPKLKKLFDEYSSHWDYEDREEDRPGAA